MYLTSVDFPVLGSPTIAIGIPFLITFPVLNESINFFKLKVILSNNLFNSFHMLANSTSS